MAITRLFQSGLESGDESEFVSFNASVVSTGSPKTGAYHLLVNNWVGASTTFTATRQIRTGFWFDRNGVAPGAAFEIFWTGGYSVALRWKSDTLYIFEGGGEAANHAITLTDAYVHIGLDIKVHSSAGWVVVYIDGVEEFRHEGNTGNADMTGAGWGSNNGNIGADIYFDDMYVDDMTGEAAPVSVPIKRFHPIGPNGNGNYADWTGSDGNQVDNYDMVNETPDNADTDYVYTTAADNQDSYAMGTHTLALNEVCVAVIPYALVKRSGATEQIKIGTRYAATDALSAAKTPSGSYTTLWERQTTKPGGGSWSQAAIDGLELLIESSGTF